MYTTDSYKHFCESFVTINKAAIHLLICLSRTLHFIINSSDNWNWFVWSIKRKSEFLLDECLISFESPGPNLHHRLWSLFILNIHIWLQLHQFNKLKCFRIHLSFQNFKCLTVIKTTASDLGAVVPVIWSPEISTLPISPCWQSPACPVWECCRDPEWPAGGGEGGLNV